jgi:hypothetical protein
MKVNNGWLTFGRDAGSGGGGQGMRGGTVPFFCKRCGKTTSAKKVMDSCDVCSRCRVKK